jgi:pimeloyl-ACP methyl ester carboxylesterase
MPERSWVEVDGAEIELLTWGERGRPGVLLLHGFRAHADWWSHLAPQFANTRRVAAMSWSGMGRSSWRDAYTFLQYTREAVQAAAAAGLFDSAVRPIVVAHSLGGHVAAMLAATVGTRFTHTILVDTSLRARPRVPPEDSPRRIYATTEDAIAKFRFTPPQPFEPYVAEWIARHSLTPAEPSHSQHGWVWSFDPRLSSKLAVESVWPLLPVAQCPLTFVRGAHSRLVTDAVEARQREQAPAGSRFMTIPDAGHHLLVDQPLAFVAALQNLFDLQ